MVNDAAQKGLKLIHLMWVLVAGLLAVGVAWGITTNQQKTNTKEIDNKVSVTIFDQHEKYQDKQMEQLNTTMQNGFTGMKEQMDKIEKKM